MSLGIRIREVDGVEAEDDLHILHRECYGEETPLPAFDIGDWWLAEQGDVPVAFAGLHPSMRREGMGYLCRVGVSHAFRGQGLQRRLIRVRERRARSMGWTWLVTDTTTDSVASANSLIRCGYRLYWPEQRWALPTSLYWRKEL